MDKEMEELVLLGIGAFLLISVLGGGAAATSKLSLAAIQGQTSNNNTYANDAASVINTALGDFSD